MYEFALLWLAFAVLYVSADLCTPFQGDKTFCGKFLIDGVYRYITECI